MVEAAIQWFYSVKGQKFGPVSTAEFRERVLAGEIAGSDLVWREGMGQWVPAMAVKGLMPLRTSASPPLPNAGPPPLPDPTGNAGGFPSLGFFTANPNAIPQRPSESGPSAPARLRATIPQHIAGLHRQRFGVLLAAAFGGLGTFLPWVHLPFGSVAGTHGDGWITLGLYICAIVAVCYGDAQRAIVGAAQFWVLLPAGLASLIGLFDLINIHSRIREFSGTNPFAESLSATVHAGAGLYFVIAAGFVACGLTLWLAAPEYDRRS